MFGKVFSELRASWADYREVGDLAGHLRALLGVLLGYTTPDDRRWEARP